MAGVISFDGESDIQRLPCSDDDAPPAVNAYTEGYSCTGDRKGKGPVWK